MTTLLLRLAGPLQSWGSSSRFAYRYTDTVPTKSGVLGLVAAALGVTRDDEDTLGWLASAAFAVRTDRPGAVVRDFHSSGVAVRDDAARLAILHNGLDRSGYGVRTAQGKLGPDTSDRYYLADAEFVAAVTLNPQQDMPSVEQVAEALRRPAFTLYLGRRSCPPAEPALEGVTHSSAEEALRSARFRVRSSTEEARLRRRIRDGDPPQLTVTADAASVDEATYTVNDIPLSFAATDRRYRSRSTALRFVPLTEEMMPCG